MSIMRIRSAVTLSDVAKAAGVSKGTASNVFNRPDIVRDELRERVISVAKSLGYTGPDPMGRLLSAGKVNAIGVATINPLSHFFEDPFARALMAAISEACDEYRIGVSLISASSKGELAWNIQNAVIDGLVLFCLEGTDLLINASLERQLPFVALTGGYEDRDISAIGIDDVAGAKLAASHLAELGHRRFAILALEFPGGVVDAEKRGTVSSETQAVSADRIQGYFEALKSFGIDTSSVPIFDTGSERKKVHAALEKAFSAPSPPTAILAQSDRIAFIAIEWLRQKGFRVPADVSIVGFDGVPESASSNPPLTTIEQPFVEIGKMAVATIMDRSGEVRREIVDARLVVRGSTTVPRP
ncbi:MAG: LacI family DNA-binding transcriptional regulator [Rhizobiaceae bacterium]|nr:LacI family DNA-binding transcriptional regulator [Rhizobiaceae bacterium]